MIDPKPSMFDRLSLLRLYSEWGIDETLTSLCTNHLENVKHTTPIPLKKNQVPSITQPEKPLQAQNVTEISQLIKGFKEFPLHKTAMNSILPQGDPQAPIFIISEVPDADEDRSGIVLQGISSFWLKQLFDSIELSLEHCFRMPIIPWRPPGGRQISATELKTCLPFVQKILQLYQPKYIITVGITPAQALIQTTGSMNQLRGKWHDIQIPFNNTTFKLFPLRHPSHIHSSAKTRKETWNDLLKIRQFIKK